MKHVTVLRQAGRTTFCFSAELTGDLRTNSTGNSFMTPMTEIEVSGTRRTVTLDAIIDTGFDGEICVPIDDGVTLGLELKGKTFVELADGSQKVELLFAGSVTFLNKHQNV